VAWLKDPAWRSRFLAGDRALIEDIYRATFEEVRRATARVLREPADRDAVVHDVFVEILSSAQLRESYRGGHLSAWLGAIARHHALDFARRQSYLTELSAATAGAEMAAKVDPMDELRREVIRYAAGMHPERRRMVELRYLEGRTQMEAAAILGKPRSTVEDWEHQFREAFRGFLGGKG
jgi:RNA polymerase sigma-70 factor (ECF subfamily)